MDYISREAVLKLAYSTGKKPTQANPYGDMREVVDVTDIEALPAADVREVVRGEWIEEKGLVPRCSVCGKYSDDAATGEAICCAFCGAMMGGSNNV